MIDSFIFLTLVQSHLKLGGDAEMPMTFTAHLKVAAFIPVLHQSSLIQQTGRFVFA